MRLCPTLAVLVFALVSTTTMALQGDPAAGQLKSAACVACHNADGNSTTPLWPKIAGQHEEYLYRQLVEFRKGPEGKRHQPVMLAIVQDLSDQDLADLAAFYAAQTQTSGKANPNLVEAGERLYRGGDLETGVSACSACHGPAGLGNGPANFPRLGGQHATYIVDQLQKFRSGERHNDTGMMMQDIAKRMTDEQMQAVASYIEGLGLAPAEQ